MKSCPTCNRTYADETLTFCLVDGSILSAPYGPHQTQQMPLSRSTNADATEVLPPASTGHAPLQSTIVAAPPSVPSFGPANSASRTDEAPKRSLMPWIVVSAAIVIVGIVAVVIILPQLTRDRSTSRTQPSPSPESTTKPQIGTMCGQTVSIAILEKWNELGGQSGRLGCPINQEKDAPPSPQGTTGRWIQFAKGDGGYLIAHAPRKTDQPNINVKPSPFAGRVFEVTGCMFKLYASLGGTESWLGFPISDGLEIEPGARQNFEGGYVEWDRKTYRCQTRKN